MLKKIMSIAGFDREPDPLKMDNLRETPCIVVTGNMNVGKTTIFSSICKTKTTSMNIPGTTGSLTFGSFDGGRSVLCDTPGIVSIFSSDEDDRGSRDILIPLEKERPVSGIVLVADAKNLKRSISIALQLAEYELPMLFVVNMADEAASRGIEIDHGMLSEILEIDVCVSVAREGIGIPKIVSRLQHLKKPRKQIVYPEPVTDFTEIVRRLTGPVPLPHSLIALLLIVGDRRCERYIEEKFDRAMLSQLKDLADDYRKEASEPFPVQFGKFYNKTAEEIVEMTRTLSPPPKSPFLVSFGDWCTQPVTGIPIAAAVLLTIYLFVGTFGATFLVDAIRSSLFDNLLVPWFAGLTASLPDFLREMIMDPDFGILPTGVFLALGLVLPVMFCFYIAFGILEDSGYLPRLSVLLDKVFQKMGLNGKGVIPITMGFSCVTMAILTTRLLNTEKEKNIASFLLFLCLPCAPMMAVMLIILDKMPASAMLAVFGTIFSQIFLAGYLANRLLPGKRTPLFMEIPPMRFPKARHVVSMATRKSYFFIKEALPVFVLASLCIFLFARAGGLEILENATGPFIKKFMGLPEKSIQVFIKTMIRRESGATELEHMGLLYNNLQLIVNLLVMTFISPCINATIVLFKERGPRAAMAISAAVVLHAFIIGSIFNHACLYFGITFT